MHIVIGNFLGFRAAFGASCDVISFSYWKLSRKVIHCV